MVEDFAVEELLRRATERLEGRPLTEQEAAEAHAFAAECAELRDGDDWLELLTEDDDV